MLQLLVVIRLAPVENKYDILTRIPRSLTLLSSWTKTGAQAQWPWRALTVILVASLRRLDLTAG